MVGDGRRQFQEAKLITLGVICLIVGLLLAVPVLWTIGVILVVVGLLMVLLGATGRAVGGRRHYY